VQVHPQKLWLWAGEVAWYSLYDSGTFRTIITGYIPNLRQEIHPENFVYDFHIIDKADPLVS